MTQALRKLTTFDEFVAKYPDETGKRYELHDGVVVEMPQPTGEHEEVTGFLAFEITRECIRLNLPYFIPKTALVKPPENESAYSPDVLLLNRPNLANEPLWKKESTVIQGISIPLIIEVVSTNWRDDYLKKYADYVRVASRREVMGIPEYWIVDYAGLGGREFIGNPKQPTILVCCLEEGEYTVRKFRGDNRIQSVTFPDLNLTAQQIFNASL
ncbi:Uma2 family endonuclease [Nostoc sp. UHCC 0870]|uniref:Uma2 family endonuclease n=1 Tax=Nostoc sp. UHCC 0870 TaxID=2914041 RepID=UPI001EE09315|nr:Uma2 family endonuclease [Nostoc sp. UHCC 0870]UKO99201.1 Uma2 family endonuclease [Nostoc sp. UHCC 0870]